MPSISSQDQLYDFINKLELHLHSFLTVEELTGVGSWQYDTDTATCTFSNNFYGILGFEPDAFDLAPEKVLALLYPEDRFVLREAFDRFKKAREHPSVDVRFTRRDGEQRIANLSARAHVNKRGNDLILGVVQDVTEERKREREAIEKHQRLIFNAEADRHALRFAKVGTWSIDLKTTDITWSENMYRLLDYNPLAFEPLPDDLFNVVHEHDRSLVEEQFAFRRLNKSNPSTLDFRVSAANGSTRHMHMTYGLVEIERKEFAIGTMQDVTERKEAELEMQKKLALLQRSEDAAQSGSWVYEVDTGAFNWSDGMYRFFNLPVGTVVKPETFAELASEENKTTALSIVDHFKRRLPFEDVLSVGRNGSQRTLLMKGSVIYDESGEPDKLIGVDVDITERVKMEQEIRRKLYLLEAVADILPAAVSEPQRMIQSFIDDLKNDTIGIQISRGKNHIERIQSSALLLNRALEDLLDYVALLGDTSEAIATDLNEILNEALAAITPVLEQRQTIITANKLPVVNAVPQQIRQLFQRLISTVVEPFKPGISLRVRVSYEAGLSGLLLHPELRKDRDYIRIVVASQLDYNSIDLEKFEPFVHEQNSGELNLTICKKIAANHQGVLEKEASRNAAFAFYLPLL